VLPPNKPTALLDRTTLCRIAAEEVQLAALRAALIEGENSGPATEFDFAEFVARKSAG
jgi:antitoxin ParD1/3/4